MTGFPILENGKTQTGGRLVISLLRRSGIKELERRLVFAEPENHPKEENPRAEKKPVLGGSLMLHEQYHKEREA